MRPGDDALRSKLDAFLIEKAFRARVTDELGDLPAIKQRGTLRVLTRNNAVSFYLSIKVASPSSTPASLAFLE